MRILGYILLILSSCAANAQEDSAWLPAPPPHYSFIQYNNNTIDRSQLLHPVLARLVAQKATGSGRVSIVHIGDSHMQGDGMTNVVRYGFQDYFGNAGRGLVFPYQVANTNAPPDVKSGTHNTWKSNKITTPDKPIKTGISGYGIHSSAPDASVSMYLRDAYGRQETFDRMVFFLCNDSVCYRLTDSSINAPVLAISRHAEDTTPLVIQTNAPLSGFELSRTGGNETDYSFYGVSLEKRNTPGVLYHTIGINGARYDQFLASTLFWNQLQALHADLYIVSLGTNEAQNMYINQQALMDACTAFIAQIKAIAPKAAILITTPAGSYYRGKTPNKSLIPVSEALKKAAEANNVACWDLFGITNKNTGTAMLKKYGLLSRDLVHYSATGYQLQGALLLNALAHTYNAYSKQHPYKAPKTLPVKTTAAPTKPAAKVEHLVEKPTIITDNRPAPTMPTKPAADTTRRQPTIPPAPAQKKKSNIVVEYSD